MSFEWGSKEIPLVLRDLAETLPLFEGPDLESQLQTFDSFLAMLHAEARPGVAELLLGAAKRNANPVTAERIQLAAKSIQTGGRAAEAYDHRAAMRKYSEAHQARFDPKPDEGESGQPTCLHPAGGRQVESEEYLAYVRESGAVLAFDNRGGIGETERWEKDGRVVAKVNVRYFRGENEYDYYICR